MDPERPHQPGEGGSRAGRPRRLTTEEVIEAAIEIADEQGLGGLSMPKLAKKLGVGTMTLYGYVDSKLDLENEVTKRLFADLTVRPSGDWQAAMIAFFLDFREAAIAHPSLGSLLANGRITIPEVFDILESFFRRMTDDGLTVETACRTFYSALSYTIGFVIWEIPRSHLQPERAYAEQWEELISQLDPVDHPLLRSDEALRVAQTTASRQQFMWGLETLVHGRSIE